MVELQLLNLWLLLTVLKGEKDGVMAIWWLEVHNVVSWVILHIVHNIRLVYVWTSPKEANNPECPVPTVKHGNRSVMIWAAISSILLVLYFGWSNYCQWLRGHFRARCVLWSRCCFLTMMQFFKTMILPYTQPEVFSLCLRSMKMHFNI